MWATTAGRIASWLKLLAAAERPTRPECLRQAWRASRPPGAGVAEGRS